MSNELDIFFSVKESAPTISRFMRDDHFFRGLMGPFGCVDADTEYLSPLGWKRIADYDGGQVAQFVFDSKARYDVHGRAEYVQPLQYIKEPCREMYRFKTKYGCDQKLSAEHRVPYVTRKGALRELLACEVAERHWEYKAGFEGKFLTTFRSPPREGIALTDAQLRVMVAVIADGSYDPRGKCYVNVKKERKQVRFQILLEAAGIKYTINKSAPGYKRFAFYAPIKAKEFDGRFWEATQAQLFLIADEVQHWDSHVTERGGISFSSLNKVSADFIQYVFAATGTRSSLTTTDRVDKGFIEYSVMTTTSTDMVSLNGYNKEEGVRRDNIQVEPTTDGFKYCFSVPSSYLVLRRNGCVFVTGNSGKTSGCIMEMLRRCIEMPHSPDGFRRSRWAIVRNTAQQLKDTTIKSVFETLPNNQMWHWKPSEQTLILSFNDIRAEWIFRPLDTPEDVQRVKSLQLTGAFLDEGSEIPVDIVNAIMGRVRRYPRRQDVPNYWSGVITATNPPEIDSPWYNLIEGLPQVEGDDNSIIDVHFYKQPSGVSPEAENLQFLHPDYYRDLAKGKDEDYVNAYVHGLYRKSQAGKPVYQRQFKYEKHVAKAPIKIYQNLPLIGGLDFARNPAGIFGQMHPDGRIKIIRESVGSQIGFKTFIDRNMKPIIRNAFGGIPGAFIGDPSGVTRNNTDDNNCFKELEKEFPRKQGYRVRAAETNDPTRRINALGDLLTDFPDGEPLVEIDPSCKTLIEGLRSKYRYKKLKGFGENYSDTPDKLHPWSDVIDAAQYFALFIAGRDYDPADYIRAQQDNSRRIVHRPADSYTGY